MNVLVDTSALLALFRENDAWHVRTRDWLATAKHVLVTPASVVQETAFMFGNAQGPEAEAAFVRAASDFTIERLEVSDLSRSADLIAKYADFPIGFVDASIVAIAERLDIRELLTTDRRHFGVIRPAHCERLRLLP
jgi:predicted nucleic acid-binding protein